MDAATDVAVSEDYEWDTHDRLSELPDSLIHTIFSFMEMRDVVKTTFLSKRWNHLWITVPFLHFRYHSHDSLDSFKKFVNLALALWKGTKILRFRMSLTFRVSILCDVDSWLLFAIEKQVEDLYLNLNNNYKLESHQLKDLYVNLNNNKLESHQRLYSCSSLRKLSIVCFELKQIEEDRVKWNRLNSLVIRAEQPLLEDVMNKIICGAPHLEALDLTFANSGAENLIIESTRLKMLKIYKCINSRIGDGANNTIMRISAPNLETLELSGVPYSKCLINVPCLTNVILCYRNYYSLDYYSFDESVEEILRQVFQSIRRVENLTLSAWCIKVLVELKKKDRLEEFSNAKILKFYVKANDDILVVLEMFPKLIMLSFQLDNPGRFLLARSNPKTSFPSPSLPLLKRIEIIWDLCNTSIVAVAEILLANAHVLKKMVFWSRWNYDPERWIEKKLLSIPRSSPTAEVIVMKDPYEH